GVNHLLRTGRCEANQINYRVGVEGCDTRSKRPGSILGGAVDLDKLSFAPRRVWNVGLALSSAGDNHLVSGIDETRNEECADVTGPTNDDDSHDGERTVQNVPQANGDP